MLGMAVDANVLIYERLREERDRGAGLALAIRNGYDRALPTIIDTHLSSIFTAVVLYIVGNDQLKGFGISLTAGLIISLFTSLYVTRTIFDIWMGKGWLKDHDHDAFLFRRQNLDFMAIRNYLFTATVILTILGVGIFIYRLDKGGLNIDFVGGTPPTAVSSERLRDRRPTGRADEGLSLIEASSPVRAKLFVSDPHPERGQSEAASCSPSARRKKATRTASSRRSTSRC